MLTVQRRSQLDGIVQEMLQNNESDDNIQFVVDDFKQKYEHETLGVSINDQNSQIPPKNEGLIDKTYNAVNKVMGPASNLLFGSTSKTVGKLIAGGAESAAELVEGTDIPKEKKVGYSVGGEKATKTDILFTGLELYPGGGFVSSALKKLPGGTAVAELITKHIPKNLKASAIKQFSEALGATTNELKAKTAKVVPKLLNKNTVITTLPKFAGKVADLKSVAGKAVRKAEDMLPVFKKELVEPILDKTAKLRNQYIVNGKILDESAVKAVDNVVFSIKQFGKEIPDTQLIKIRRVLDKSVALANKNFTKEEGLSLATEAKEGIANSIRNILNKGNPKLEAANKEFNLWADVEKITAATLKRRSTQSNGITRFIGPLIGGGAGFASGGAAKAVIAYLATDAAIKLLQSPAYKTVNAVAKTKLAKYLAEGNIKDAVILTEKLIAGIKNLADK